MPDDDIVENALAVQDVNSLRVSHSARPIRNPQPSFKESVFANIGKRRALAGQILCSPARQGHQSRMTEIFSDARAQLDNMSDVTAAPRRPHQSVYPLITEADEVIHPPLSLRLDRHRNLYLPNVTSQQAKASLEIVYPVLPTPHDSGRDLSPQRGRRLSRETDARRTPPPRFHHRLQRRDAPYSTETLKPERYYANLGRPAEAPQSDTALSEYSSEHTSSSASWTGDSQFYYIKPQPLPQQQRQTSVSEWLERLPEKLEELGAEKEDDEEDETPMSPLSPNVELERGTVRRRRIGRQVGKRCMSYYDEDIFGVKT